MNTGFHRETERRMRLHCSFCAVIARSTPEGPRARALPVAEEARAQRVQRSKKSRISVSPMIFPGTANGHGCMVLSALSLRGVRRKGLVCISARMGRNRGSHQFLNWWQQYATGILRFNFSSPIPGKKIKDTKRCPLFFGTPEGTRTPDLLVRSQSLYPTELPAHIAFLERLSILSHNFRKCKCFLKKF